VTAGESASGQTITIVGTGVQGVDITVPLAEVDQVKTGQHVTVSADGQTTVLHGTVESIGLLSTTSGSTTTFPVTVQLDAGSPHLYDGTGADVVVTTGTATNVLTVPNSAVHTAANGTHTVTVVQGGKTSTVLVTLGVAGDDVTQIKSGLKAGQQVVLADLGQPLPSSTSTSNTGTFRPGQFGGGGFGGAGGAGRAGR
jgi:multidrug efflux pump subunit AcrA (membrane-fusion protein)